MIIYIVVFLVVAELLGLVWLGSTVATYKKYWTEKAKETGEITYLALGDSAAQGIGATSPERGYVGQIAKRLEHKTGKKVRTVNLSKTGAKMGDYLKEQAPQIAGIPADLITIEIGANDITNFDAEKYRLEFRQVLATLPDGAFVSNMPVFNSRPFSTKNAKQASVIIQEELKAFPNLYFVDLEKQTQKNQSIFGFAPDLFHPNNASYKNWTDAFWLRIENTEQLF